MKLSKCCDEEVKFMMVDDLVGKGIHEQSECPECGELDPETYEPLTSFYKCKQSGDVLSEDEMLDEVDEDDALDSFYLIGDFETKEEAIDHLETIG